jgi:chromosome segregation ATPase
MAPSPSTRPKPALVALVLLAPTALAGCGYTLERTSQIEAREQVLAAAETRERALQRQNSEMKGALDMERHATQNALDELSALRRRLRAARVQVASLERSRVATDAPTPMVDDSLETAQQRLAELEQRATDEETRRRSLQAEADWTQQTLAERQQVVAGLERRLQALQTEVATAEATLAERNRELAGIREQIARERATGAPATGGGAQPEGGGAPR